MLKRTITGAVLVALLVGFFFLRNVNHNLFLIAVALISAIGTFEINSITAQKTHTAQKAVSIACSVLAVVLFYFFGLTGALVCYALTFIALFFIPVFTRGNYSFESLSCSVFCTIYPSAFLLPVMLMNNLGAISTFALVLTFVLSPAADVFAYLVGRTFKGKKLCPEISPKKTISGAIGGLIGSSVAGVLIYLAFKNTFTYHNSTSPYIYFALVGLVAGVLTELGDLVESFIKRSFNVKDSGKIFPGHGGMLDRFDGFIFAAVFVYFVVALF